MMIAPERFVLETLEGGGILLDLHSAILFQINGSAAFIWERMLGGMESGRLVSSFAETFYVSQAAAEDAVAAALDLPSACDLAERATPFRYEHVEDRYVFFVKGLPVIEILGNGTTVRRLPQFKPDEGRLYLRTVAPKLVSLLGMSVLHASAIRRPDERGVLAVMGNSGAGKTTTAHALVTAARTPGWEVVCEDKLVVVEEGDTRLAAVLGAEGDIMRWIERATQALTSHPEATCDTVDLADAGRGPRIAITEVLLIDEARRQGEEIRMTAIGRVTAAAALFHQAFYGSAAPEDWRRAVRAAATLARTARVFEATMPAGLEHLQRAAARYTAAVTF